MRLGALCQRQRRCSIKFESLVPIVELPMPLASNLPPKPARGSPMQIKFGIVSAALFLTACAGNDHRDLEQFVAESGENLRGRVPPVAQVRTPDPVVYQAF